MSTAIYDTLLTLIRRGECALILGPLFAITKDGKKVNELLKSELRDKHEMNLDTDFENIFILKDNSHMEDFKLLHIIESFYPLIQSSIHPLYESIARINFSTIVNFTQDEFLPAAFRKVGNSYAFRYFYARGASQHAQSAEELPPLNGHLPGRHVPVIYNLYGSYTYSSSLIISYDAFYEFLFSFMGEKQQAELDDMIKRLAESKAFLFLGFDLKKWYVPLLLRRLLSMPRIAGSGQKVAIATLDDTADREHSNYMEWLARYPFRMNFIDLSVPALIRDIDDDGQKEMDQYGLPGLEGDPLLGKRIFRQKTSVLARPISISEANDKISRDSSEDEMISTCEGLGSYFLERNSNGYDIKMLKSFTGMLNALKRDRAQDLPYEQVNYRLSEIRGFITDFIQQKLNYAGE